jgi:UDP-3-O-[3-hydroxymyristoyl] N-acetylglucosamine deacetylase
LKQRTLSKVKRFSGIGLHKGKKVEVKLIPAHQNTGIIFIVNNKKIKLNSKLVKETTLCTGIEKDGIRLNTIEHFLFALNYLGIDNICVELNDNEMPILDGSAMSFIMLLKEAGIKELYSNKKYIKIKKEIKIDYEDKYIIAKPSQELRVDMTIDFDHPAIGNQNVIIDSKSTNILKEISRARTFGFLKDIDYLRSNNLALGGSMDNAIVLDEYSVLNQDGLRMKKEFVYHKLLDFLGDTYMEGLPMIADIKTFKSGHHINNLFMRELMSNQENYEIVTINDINEKEKNIFDFLHIFS